MRSWEDQALTSLCDHLCFTASQQSNPRLMHYPHLFTAWSFLNCVVGCFLVQAISPPPSPWRNRSFLPKTLKGLYIIYTTASQQLNPRLMHSQESTSVHSLKLLALFFLPFPSQRDDVQCTRSKMTISASLRLNNQTLTWCFLHICPQSLLLQVHLRIFCDTGICSHPHPHRLRKKVGHFCWRLWKAYISLISLPPNNQTLAWCILQNPHLFTVCSSLCCFSLIFIWIFVLILLIRGSSSFNLQHFMPRGVFSNEEKKGSLQVCILYTCRSVDSAFEFPQLFVFSFLNASTEDRRWLTSLSTWMDLLR